MKNTIIASTLLLSALLMSFAPRTAASQKKVATHYAFTKTSIKWKNPEIDLGQVTQNKPVTIEFEFTNVGENPVLITQVQASCGCTSTNYSKTPVMPGESTKITAVFNAAAKGIFKKQVTVTTNAEETPKILTFTGTVI